MKERNLMDCFYSNILSKMDFIKKKYCGDAYKIVKI